MISESGDYVVAAVGWTATSGNCCACYCISALSTGSREVLRLGVVAYFKGPHLLTQHADCLVDVVS